MSEFKVKDPNSIGVAFMGVGRMGQTHIQTLAGIRNVRVVVVADHDAATAEKGREIARAGRGISAAVLHVPSLKPVDALAIAAAARPLALVVSVEEHTILGGLGGLVAEILGEHAPRRLVRIGIQDTWGESAANDFLLNRHGLSAERIAQRVALEMTT